MQAGEIEGGAPLPRQRARALERVGAVVVRAHRELGELLKQQRLVAAEENVAVADVRLERFDAQRLILRRADALNGQVQARLGALAGELLLEEPLELVCLRAEKCVAAARFAAQQALLFQNVRDDAVRVAACKVRVVDIGRAAVAVHGEGDDGGIVALRRFSERGVAVAVKPEVTLGDYKGIEVEKKTVKVMAADVNAEIDKVREQNSRMITVENRGIKKDDTAVIDFEGFVDGEPFQGGKGEDYSLVIGSHSFIDTFEDQLVGKKAGEEVDVNVTFPEEYHEASLKGKPALFKVTVKEIKKKELPKLDDEFASEVSEFETLKEYKASVKKNLTERRKEEAKREKENEVVEKVVENITVELPEPMVDEQTQQMIQEFAGRLSSQGLSFDQYMQMTGMTVDALMGQMKPEAEKRIRTRLALEAIVDAEKIKATAKDIDKEIENMANMYQMEVDKIKEMIGDAEKEQIGKDLAVQKAVDFVVKNAVEVEPAEEDKEEK